MARPRKEQQNEYRVPTWHEQQSRWRLRIDHAHGQKTFTWSAPRTPTCPPQIIAAAVAVQDQWRALVNNWPDVSYTMRRYEPEKEWSKPAWVDAQTLADYEQRFQAEQTAEAQYEQSAALKWVATHGLGKLVAAAEQPGALALDGNLFPTLRQNRPEAIAALNQQIELERVQLLQHLAPAKRRLAPVTVRQALMAYLAYHRPRTELLTGDDIEDSTFKTLRKQRWLCSDCPRGRQ